MPESNLEINKSLSASKPLYILKDSPPELVAAADVQPQGRKYSKEISEQQPGAVRIDEVVLGMKYASLAITDDEEGTLAKVGKANPWHIEALKIITGSEEEAHKPLTTILSEHMGLTLDTIIDISGVTPGGHPLDTQGYIAHNDEVIVLAFRCTTSLKDWLTNLNTTHSDWELEEDLAQGFSGYLSGLEGLCCTGGEYKPRVHTGFYNNFLATAPLIKQHIDPLLKPDQPARKLYVVGHSLGAGIATLASCYFLLEHDWTQLPQKLVSITAGSPRAVQNSMKEIIDENMNILRPLDKAVLCRLVRDKDVVPTVPPSFLGFKHIGKLVHITDDGEILINPKVKEAMKERDAKELLKENPDIADVVQETQESRDESEEEKPMSSYERLVAKIPKPFRDHMPDFYLTPLLQTFERDYGKEEKEEEGEKEDELGKEDASAEVKTKGSLHCKKKNGHRKKKSLGRIFSSKKKSSKVDPATVSADS